MIRKATFRDVKAIQSLVNSYADSGQMLPRTLNELYEHLRDFHVYEDNGSIVGAAALHVSWEGLAEIRSLAVRQDRVRRGMGAELVRRCLAEAAELRVERVFVLTYRAGFFRNLGFFDVDKKELPHKIWTDCLNCVKFPDCDESALFFTVAVNAT
jgi:amino-acid N-acetyltransferase